MPNLDGGSSTSLYLVNSLILHPALLLVFTMALVFFLKEGKVKVKGERGISFPFFPDPD